MRANEPCLVGCSLQRDKSSALGEARAEKDSSRACSLQNSTIADPTSLAHMGIGSLIHGAAGRVDPDSLADELNDFLLTGETVDVAFKLVRDFFVLTDWRLIYVDKQGLTGKKRRATSVPYKSITRISVETRGTLDRDAELDIFITGAANPLRLEIYKDEALLQAHAAILKKLRLAT